MKTLYLLRHAKAAPPLEAFGSIDDKERDLSPQADEQAKELTRKIHKTTAFYPEVLYYSSARRARETYRLLDRYSLLNDTASYELDELYMADAHDLLSIVRSFDDSHAGAALIGHNPGIHQLALALTDSGDADSLHSLANKFPTLAYVELCFDAGKWEDVGVSSAELATFLYPKDYLTSMAAKVVLGAEAGNRMGVRQGAV